MKILLSFLVIALSFSQFSFADEPGCYGFTFNIFTCTSTQEPGEVQVYANECYLKTSSPSAKKNIFELLKNSGRLIFRTPETAGGLAMLWEGEFTKTDTNITVTLEIKTRKMDPWTFTYTPKENQNFDLTITDPVDEQPLLLNCRSSDGI